MIEHFAFQVMVPLAVAIGCVGIGLVVLGLGLAVVACGVREWKITNGY